MLLVHLFNSSTQHLESFLVDKDGFTKLFSTKLESGYDINKNITLDVRAETILITIADPHLDFKTFTVDLQTEQITDQKEAFPPSEIIDKDKLDMDKEISKNIPNLQDSENYSSQGFVRDQTKGLIIYPFVGKTTDNRIVNECLVYKKQKGIINRGQPSGSFIHRWEDIETEQYDFSSWCFEDGYAYVIFRKIKDGKYSLTKLQF